MVLPDQFSRKRGKILPAAVIAVVARDDARDDGRVDGRVACGRFGARLRISPRVGQDRDGVADDRRRLAGVAADGGLKGIARVG